ncbi:MAG: tetratricopeptide repeat protein, partial [Deltaproteobacteria bacterium]|nr:tetratricopeptide repeat protein [Kofleriaceae bacterium]
MTGLGDIDGLIARGLDRYRAGDIDGALTAWEAALAVDPNEPRALGYVDYVRQNYDELSGGSTEALAEMLIPFGLARGDDDDGDDYEISIIPGEEESPQESTETGSFAKLDPGAERTIAGARAGAGAWAPQVPEGEPRAESIDDGWGLDAESEPTWFVGPTRKALDFASAAAAGAAGASDEPTNSGRAWGEVGDDDRTRDFQHAKINFPPAFGLDPPDPAIDLAPELPNDPARDPSGESTLELGRAGAADESGLSFGEDFTGERTTERGAAQLAA